MSDLHFAVHQCEFCGKHFVMKRAKTSHYAKCERYTQRKMSKSEATQKVWITHWRSAKIYHTDEDCQMLNDMATTKREVALSYVETYRECKICQDGTDAFKNKETGNEPKECPLCGEVVGKLPPHIRKCPKK